MKIRNRTLLFAAFAALAPLTHGCVADKDVSAMNIKMRTMDSRLVDLEKNVDGVRKGDGKGSSLESIQRQQAELSDTADRLRAEMLQIKGQIEENSHRSQQVRQEGTKMSKDLYARLDDLESGLKSVQERLDRTESRLDGTTAEIKTFLDSRTRVEAEKATAAARVARDAEQKAAAAGVAGQKTIKPEKEKKKSDDDGAPGPTAATAAAAEEPGQELYNKALQAYKENNFKESQKLFSSFIDKHPKSPNVPNARYWLADSLYNQKDYDVAILEYHKIVQDSPKHNKVPAALLKQGMAFEKLGDKETAKAFFQKIVTEYPKSEQVEAAQKRLSAM